MHLQQPVFGSSSTPALRAKSSISSLSMSCRRNLKKEKRARNEQMARQYRKVSCSDLCVSCLSAFHSHWILWFVSALMT